MDSGFAKRLVSDRFGWSPWMASRCEDAVLFAGVRSHPIWGRSTIRFSRESPRVVDCRIWVPSSLVHDVVALVDVHDADTAGWLTEHLVLGTVASGLGGCRCERFG